MYSFCSTLGQILLALCCPSPKLRLWYLLCVFACELCAQTENFFCVHPPLYPFVGVCVSVFARRRILMRDGLVWADTSLPPLEPIRIIIKITRHSPRPWLPSISIRNPSLSPSGRSETSFHITRLTLCLEEQVATATSPNGDISTVDICFFASVCLSVSLRLSVFAFSLPLSLSPAGGESDSLIQIPDPYKSAGLYTPRPQNSFENHDTLASPSSPIKCMEQGRGAQQIKK